jgi:hypothetical protein
MVFKGITYIPIFVENGKLITKFKLEDTTHTEW